MFDQLSAEILASLIKGFPRTATTRTTTTKQNVDPAVYYVYSRVKMILPSKFNVKHQIFRGGGGQHPINTLWPSMICALNHTTMQLCSKVSNHQKS
jgi:hypothetical protein